VIDLNKHGLHEFWARKYQFRLRLANKEDGIP
jgi:hypothetical protein